MERLGYRRNALASAMKAARTGLIGILVPNFDEFHRDLLTELTVCLRRAGLMSLTHCHDNTPETVASALDFFRNYRVDALVMGGSPDHLDAIRDLIAGGTRIITYDNPHPHLRLDGVEVDNIGGAEAATRHLIEAGHSRIGILAGPRRTQTGRDRLEGWRRALRAAGLEAPTSWPSMPRGPAPADRPRRRGFSTCRSRPARSSGRVSA